jgi:pimeloyl-ACP methyl ester carboxylesterase
MKTKFWLIGLTGVLFYILAAWQIQAAGRGISSSNLPGSDPPVTILVPPDPSGALRPTVLVGHGFAGSAVVMRGFALELAHAGYPVVLWDFSGHGKNPNPLSQEPNSLLEDAERALAEAQANGLANSGQVAILGHSMGSGVALDFGVQYPDTAATIAVSPVLRQVSPQLPHNLLLIVGEGEPRFLANAEYLLEQAGGAGGDTAVGDARQLIPIPVVEHISILFSPTAHQVATDWLVATFGRQPGARGYSDRRIGWYLVGIAGAILVSYSVANLTGKANPPKDHGVRDAPHRSLWRRLGGLLLGVILASLVMWGASIAGLQMSTALNLLVGGFLLIWFAVAGIIAAWLTGTVILCPSRQEWFAGLTAFAVLWLGVGLLGQMVWLQWILIPARLWLWLPGSLLLLPWFLAVGQASQGGSGWAKAGWWAVHSALLFVGLLLAVRLNPELGFLFLILPLLPVVLGLHALVSGSYRGSWSFALSGALFLCWIILAIFPLV